MSDKFQLVELSDLLRNDSLIGCFIEVRDVRVTKYERGQLPDLGLPAYEGVVEKESLELKFKGIEDGIGIDVMYLHSQKFGHKLDLQGEIFKEGQEKYLSVQKVNPSLWRK